MWIGRSGDSSMECPMRGRCNLDSLYATFWLVFWGQGLLCKNSNQEVVTVVCCEPAEDLEPNVKALRSLGCLFKQDWGK
jgi:hypothetical protein